MQTGKLLVAVSACALTVSFGLNVSQAAVTPAEAARLGADLMPLGGEKAGNAAGTIPAWDGGISSAAKAGFPDFKSSGHHPDPYAGDKPLFTITAANMNQYADQLTEGHKALLKSYKDYFIKVYPAHRSAASPQRIYDATKRIATTANLAPGGNGVTGAAIGIPFPIPKEGVEVFWNHVLRYRADAVFRSDGKPDRTALRNRVFGDDAARVHLEEILHPIIRERSPCPTLSVEYSR